MLPRRSDRLALAILCGLILLLFADVILGRVLYLRDLTRFFHPTRKVFAEVVRGGEFPYWDPYHGAGQPMAANVQYEVFYPPQWLVLLPDFELGFALHILFHLVVAAAAMFLLLRGLRLGVAASSLGAVTFAIGGPALSAVNLLPILFAWSWMPLIILAARRLFVRPTARRFACAALLVGLQDLVFEPTVVVETAMIVVGLGLFQATRRRPSVRRIARALALAAAVTLAGLTVAAVQVVPLVDHVAGSARARGFEPEMVSWWNLPPARAIELFSPNLLGFEAFESDHWWGRAWYPVEGAPFVLSFYAGILVPVLLITGALRRPGAWFWWLVGGAALFWLLAAGGRGPAGALSAIPPLTMIRFPERHGIAALFLATIAAAAMFDRLMRDEATRRAAVRASVIVLAASLVVLGISHSGSWPEAFGAVFPLSNAPQGEAAALMRTAIVGLVARASSAFATILLFAFGRQRAAIGAALAFAVLDLSLQSFELCPRKPASFADPPALVETMTPNLESGRLFHVAEWSTASPSGRRHFADPATRMWIARNGLFPRVAANWGVRSVFDTDIDKSQLARTVDLTDAMWKVRERSNRYIEHFSAMSNVRWVALFSRDEARVLRPGDDPSRARPVDLIDVGDNPRYFLASEIVEAARLATFVDEVAKRESVRGVAFVESGAFVPSTGRLESVDESANGARVRVRAAGDVLLVASVTAHKYWRATIDGTPAAIRHVNVAYQGVVVPAGEHVVEFRYRNPLVAVGLGVTVLASLLALFVLAVDYPRVSWHR
ncbi:MAG: YfhO family protein [Thermoanaerobaculia bacterium]|nr:YfhO family protein [Thermoanaerobaculia bacterium]